MIIMKNWRANFFFKKNFQLLPCFSKLAAGTFRNTSKKYIKWWTVFINNTTLLLSTKIYLIRHGIFNGFIRAREQTQHPKQNDN
jgi:hypothetical protein